MAYQSRANLDKVRSWMKKNTEIKIEIAIETGIEKNQTKGKRKNERRIMLWI